jgi:hypothetical protein
VGQGDDSKVFCFFFSKKKAFALPFHAALQKSENYLGNSYRTASHCTIRMAGSTPLVRLSP